MFISKSTRETQKKAELLARSLLKAPWRNKAVVLALTGNLGSGKTCFLQGLARGLGVKKKINSPTFVILKRFGNFYHFDCYRIKKAKEILNLGFQKIIKNPKNIVAIEWADRIKTIIPKDALWINFKFISNKTRQIVIK